MARVTEAKARQIIADELERAGWQTASTFTVMDGIRPGSESLSWWHQNTPAAETAVTPRSIAYLRAYRRIAGGQPLYAGGLLLSRRRLWMDRSIISRLERDGYLRFVEGKNPHFELTSSGEELAQ